MVPLAFALLVLAAPEDTARCVLASAKLGGVSASERSCLEQRLAAVDKARAAKDETRLGIARNMLNTCSARVPIAKRARLAKDDAPALDDRYLDDFEAALVPAGERVGKCLAALGEGPRLAGRIDVELAVDRAGRAESVGLAKNEGADPLLVGCVVQALCAVAGPAPKAPFVVELPFEFGVRTSTTG